MSGDLLRKAATLMRERAKAVTPGATWTGGHCWITDHDPSDPSGQTAMQREIGGVSSDGDAEHIASWHPAVALAVAGWLEATAREFDALGHLHLDEHPVDGRRTAGLAVARAYLETTP